MELFLIICCLAVGHALYCVLLLFRFSNHITNRLLSFLILALAIRVGKSVTGIVLSNYAYFFSLAGLAGMVFIGPLMRLFIRSFFETSFRFEKIYWLEFAAGVFICLGTLATGDKFLDSAYYLSTGILLVYILLCGAYLFQNRDRFQMEDNKWKWAIILLGTISVLGITFVLQLFFYDPIIYKIIVTSAACLFYALSLWAIPRSKLFLPDTRKKPSDETSYEDLGRKILSLLKEEELFTDPNLTISKLAGMVKAPPYLVSRVVNQTFKKSFSELITQFRIDKSEQLLLQKGSKALTIESIAFESGFNTLSSFYTSFKRINKVTPAQFRESGDKARMKIA